MLVWYRYSGVTLPRHARRPSSQHKARVGLRLPHYGLQVEDSDEEVVIPVLEQAANDRVKDGQHPVDRHMRANNGGRGRAGLHKGA